jgi:cupin 2 domain-containing protein
MTAHKQGSLLAPAGTADGETAETLLARPGVRVERIVSHGEASPPGFWYDQAEDEWVLLVAGAARLEIEGEGEFGLAPGDHFLLPAHCRHRVAWTDPDRPTVWLALFVAPAPV